MRILSAISVFLVGAVLTTGGTFAQSLREAGDPAETPPLDYAGAQYVDSNGCVFVRAGFGGNVTWVPRVSRDRKQLCGFMPTLAGGTDTATDVTPTAQPVASPAAAAAISAPRTATPQRVATARASRPAQVADNRHAEIPVPKGYRSAWDDGRLNPSRGPQTQSGDTQMARIWTNSVPMKSVDVAKKRKPPVAVEKYERENDGRGVSGSDRLGDLFGSITTGSVSISTKSVPGPTSSRFVQVASFADNQNAKKTIARLQSEKLPVRILKQTVGGKPLTIVLAGPLTDKAAISDALSAARGLGFSDAFLRR